MSVTGLGGLLLGWVVMHEYYRAGWLWMSVTKSGGY